MSDLLKLSEVVPERTLRLLKEWTIEDLASTKVSKLAKIRGIGLKTAQSVIKVAKQQMEKDREEGWDSERQQLRRKIEADKYILMLEQARLEMVQELSGTSTRIKRIREANA